MLPTNLLALVILVVAVIPGAMYTWGFEREASNFGASFTDRVLRFVAVSILFHVVLGAPEYIIFRRFLRGPTWEAGQFAAGYVTLVILVSLPAAIGMTLGGLYATRTTRDHWRLTRRLLTPKREELLLRIALGKTPAPRAWDDFFSERPYVYVRVRTTNDNWLAGTFADKSYAAGFPNDTDLLLEEAWEIDGEGVLGEHGLGYAVYIPAGQMAWLEFVPPPE